MIIEDTPQCLGSPSARLEQDSVQSRHGTALRPARVPARLSPSPAAPALAGLAVSARPEARLCRTPVLPHRPAMGRAAPPQRASPARGKSRYELGAALPALLSARGCWNLNICSWLSVISLNRSRFGSAEPCAAPAPALLSPPAGITGGCNASCQGSSCLFVPPTNAPVPLVGSAAMASGTAVLGAPSGIALGTASHLAAEPHGGGRQSRNLTGAHRGGRGWSRAAVTLPRMCQGCARAVNAAGMGSQKSSSSSPGASSSGPCPEPDPAVVTQPPSSPGLGTPGLGTLCWDQFELWVGFCFHLLIFSLKKSPVWLLQFSSKGTKISESGLC